MKSTINRLSDERGSVMVLALLILAFLTIMGLSTGSTSEFELKIAGNEKSHKVSFYNADAGIGAAPKLVSLCVDNGEAQDGLTGISYLDSNGEPDPSDSTLDDTFFYEIMGFDDLLGRASHDAAGDMSFALGSHTIKVDIERSGEEEMAGGGVEFASGAEGVGAGSAGGVSLLYTLDSVGAGPASSESNVGAVYRKVVGVSGGL